jgi:hypothetical protein
MDAPDPTIGAVFCLHRVKLGCIGRLLACNTTRRTPNRSRSESCERWHCFLLSHRRRREIQGTFWFERIRGAK